MQNKTTQISQEGYFLANIHENNQPVLYNQLFSMAFDTEKVGESNTINIMFPRSPFHTSGTWDSSKGFHFLEDTKYHIYSEYYAKDFLEHYIRLGRKTPNDTDFMRFMDTNTIDNIFKIPAYGDKDSARRQLLACESILLAYNQIENYINEYGDFNPLIAENLKAVKHFLSLSEKPEIKDLFSNRYYELTPYQDKITEEVSKLTEKIKSKGAKTL